MISVVSQGSKGQNLNFKKRCVSQTNFGQSVVGIFKMPKAKHILVSVIFVFGALPIASPLPKKTNKSIAGACLVDGHGPYPGTKLECLTMARDQARTNCALDLPSESKGSTPNIERREPSHSKWKWEVQDGKTKNSFEGQCYSQFDVKTKECQHLRCQERRP